MIAKVSTLLHYAASSRPVTNELAPSSPDSGSPGPSRKRRRDESGEPRPVIPKELIELFDSRIADLEREMAQKLKKLKGRVIERLDKLREDVDELREDVDELREDMAQQINEEFYGIKAELQESIKADLLEDMEDGIEQAAERVVEERLNSATLTLELGPRQL